MQASETGYYAPYRPALLYIDVTFQITPTILALSFSASGGFAPRLPRDALSWPADPAGDSRPQTLVLAPVTEFLKIPLVQLCTFCDIYAQSRLFLFALCASCSDVTILLICVLCLICGYFRIFLLPGLLLGNLNYLSAIRAICAVYTISVPLANFCCYIPGPGLSGSPLGYSRYFRICTFI